nr:hypothetical protein [Tanacetum cinerariifolium]
MTEKLFVEYIGFKVKQFRETLLLHMGNVKKYVAERTRHKRQYDKRIKERQMQSRESKVVSSKALDASLVVTECSGTKSDEHITSTGSRTYITHVVDADIRQVNNQVSSVEVHLTAQHNVLANEQQHTDQSEPSYDTYLLEKVDSNITLDSTNMGHRGGEIDQDAEQDQVKSPLLKVEFLKTKDMIEKEVYNELLNRFLQLEKHCISLEISMQQKKESFQSNKPCKNQESPEFREFFEINDLKAWLQAKTTLICNLKNQIKSVKEASNEAILKTEINVLETINIELESSVAKLLAENEKLNKENEHLKQTYKELYDSIKKTRIQTKDHNDSLIAQVNRKPVLQPHRNESVVTKPNAFKYERRNFSKPRFVSQGDVNNVLSKPVTHHYLPKVQEYVLAKPHHVIAPGSFRNNQEESYGSNDMAHNHYLEEARKKTQEINRDLKPSVMPSVRLQKTANGSTLNPKRTNQTSRSLPTFKSSCVTIMVAPKADHSRNSSSFLDSKHFFCSTGHKCVFNANHDACITKLLNEVNSRKVKSHKTKNSNNPIKQKSHTQIPGWQIFLGHRFSPKNNFAVYEKTSPRSCLRWKPTDKIFTTVGLKWIPTGKLFDSCTRKVDSQPPNASNDDITNPYECDQTLNVSACTLNLSACTSFNPIKERLRVWLPKRLISHKPWVQGIHILCARSMTSVHISSRLALHRQMASADNTSGPKDYEILFQPLFDEYFNPPPCVVSPVSAAVAALRAVDPAGSPSSTTIDQDVPSANTSPTIHEIQSQVTHQDPSSEEATLQGFIPSNLHHLNQSFDTLTKLTKNHPLENVIGDPSRPNCEDYIANENVPSPATTRPDDQIMLFNAWVPIGKGNHVLDLQKKQKNPIFRSLWILCITQTSSELSLH